jgi:hypothetical protein
MALIFDWTDFLVKLILLLGLFFVAGTLFGIGTLGLIMRDERRERREKQREIAAHKAQTQALFAEVDRILAENRGL